MEVGKPLKKGSSHPTWINSIILDVNFVHSYRKNFSKFYSVRILTRVF